MLYQLRETMGEQTLGTGGTDQGLTSAACAIVLGKCRLPGVWNDCNLPNRKTVQEGPDKVITPDAG